MDKKSMGMAVVIAGVIMGLLSSLPVINMVNCLLCTWVWSSSILAVYLYRRFSKENPQLSIAQAAGLGALTGVVGAIVGSLVGAIFSGGITATLSVLQGIPGLADLMKDMPMDVLRSGGFSVFSLISDLIVYMIFGAVGGIIAASVIWKQPAKS